MNYHFPIYILKKRWFMLCLVVLLSPVALNGQSTLNDYLLHAASENLHLKAKYSLYLAALEKVDQQNALPDPTVSFGYFISPVETRVGAQRFKASLSQMFPWAGTRKVREQAATSLAKARFEEFMAAKNQLFLQVKTKWLALYELEQEIILARDNLGILKTYEPVTKTKYESNLVSLADLVRVQIKIDEVNTQLELLALKRPSLISDFNTLLSREITSEVFVADSLTFDQSTAYSLDSVLVAHPELKAARQNLEAIDAQITLADLKRKPNIGVGLDYAFVSKRSGVTLDDNGKDILMPMVSLSLPIFRKKNQAFKKEAEFRKESLLSSLQASENDLRNDWTKTDYALARATQELALYQSEIEKTNLLLRVLTTEYTNNSLDFEELLITQQKLLALKRSELYARVAYQEALFRKDYLTATTLNQLK